MLSNETANSFAVSSGQLANNLGIVSSTSAAMGNSMEETIGMMVAITEQTRNASKSARGLNAIFANLSQVLDESSSNGKKITEIFDSLGISMYDLNTGQMLSTYELLLKLSEKWDTLDSNTQKYIATTLAGTVQLNNFLALMNNFDHAVSATETALNSAGSAARENSKYMEGLEARTNQLKATFQDFSNNVLSSEFLGGLLSLANGFLQLMNTPVGAFVTQVVLFTGAGWGLVKLFKAMNIVPVIIASLGNAFTGIKFAIEGTALAMKGLVPVTTATTLAMRAAVPIIGAVTAFIKFAKWAIDVSKEQTVTLEEQIEIVDDLRSKIKSLNSEYENLTNQGDLSEADNARLKLLEAEIEANEKILQQEEKKLYYQQFGEGSKETVKVDGDTTPASNYLTGTTSYTGGTAYGAAQQAPSVATETETKTTTGLDRLREEVVEFKKIQQQIADIEAQMDTATGDELIELNEKYSELTTNSKEYFDSISEQANSLSAFENIPEEAQSLLNYITLTFSGMADKAEESTDDISAEFVSMSESVADSISELDGLSDAFDTLTGAVDEYNENGSISIDTLSSLVELGDDYLSMLSFENGQLVLNSDALYAKAQQLRQTTIEEAKASAAAQLHSIAINGVGQASVDANNAASSSTGGLAIFESALDRVTNGALNATAAVSQLEVAFGGQWSGDQKKAMQDVINNYQNFVGLVNSSSLVGATGGSSGGGGGGGSATDPIEEQSKAFQDQIAILEHELAILEKMGASEEERIAKSREIQEAIKKQEEWYRAQGLDDNSEYLRELEEQWWDYENSIEDLYKDMAQAHLDSLNEQKSAYEKLFDIIIETADKEIEALEQKKDEEEAYWDEKIAALEEQNEALNDQIEKEEKLDALAKAKQSKVMVYKDGKFQYVSDIDAVSEAQADLDEYNREQELQDQIDKMEEQKDQALAALDEQIKGWEKYKEKWSAIVDEIGDIQDIMLIEQALGIKLEGDNWQERLTNLGIFVSDYIDAEGNFNDEAINKNGELLRNEYEQVATEASIWEQRLENFDEYIDEFIESQGDFVSKQEELADRASEAWSGSLDSLNDYVQGCKDAAKELNNIDYSGGGGGHPSLGKPGRLPEQQQFYASGTTNAIGGISLVGERGPELRVLNSGDGILPADITKNLWQWGVTTPASMMSSIVGGLHSMGQNIGITIQNFNPNLPNVTDGEGFAKYMRNNFWREALQFAKT